MNTQTCARYPHCRGGGHTHEPDCAAIGFCPIPMTMIILETMKKPEGEPKVQAKSHADTLSVPLA